MLSLTLAIAEEPITVEDSAVKGIILRINSPGGSALAAELINQKVTEIKKYKPVYISISEVAASGGYYIADANAAYNPIGSYIALSDVAFAGSNTTGTLQGIIQET